MGNWLCGNRNTFTKLLFAFLSTSIWLNAGTASAETMTFSTRMNGDEADCSLNVRTTASRELSAFYNGLARCNVYGQEDVSGTMRLITVSRYESRSAGYYAIAGRDYCYVGGTNMTGYRAAYPAGLSNVEAIDWCLDRNPRLQQVREAFRPSNSVPMQRF